MTSYVPYDTMQQFLADQPPLSDSDMLQMYKTARDQLVFSITQGEAITYLEIRNRRVQVSDPKTLLEMIEERLIPYYEGRVAAASGRSSRNYAVLGTPKAPYSADRRGL